MHERSSRVRRRRFIRQFHRWVGLLVAIQVLFWVSGGLIMSALQLEAVRGEHLIAKVRRPPLDPQGTLVPVGELLRDGRFGEVTAATLTTWQGRAVYQLERSSGAQLVDATDGRLLSPLDAAAAKAVAGADYAGPGVIQSVEWIDTPALEYRGRDLPLWRVRFDDARETTLYVSPQTGQVVARRNDLWRVFDFVWMLHIMDYEEREDFNHPLLITTAATALLFVVSGLFMLFYSFKGRRA